jgi:lipopolysaccharide export system permease protein
MTIERYLLRSIALPFGLLLSVLVVLFGGFSLTGVLSDAIGGLLPVGVIAALAALKLLIALDVLIPIALFIGVVIAFGRLQSDSEMVAFQALGVSPWQRLRPVLLLAIGLAIVVGGLSLFVRPLAYGWSHLISDRASAMLNVDAMQAGNFYASNSGSQVIFLADRRNRVGAGGVFVVRQSSERVEVISARQAEPVAGQGSSSHLVNLNGAQIYRFNLAHPGEDRVLGASNIVLDPDEVQGQPGYSPVAASVRHLAESSAPRDIAELQWRLSTGISTLLLALLGFALSGGRPRQSRFARFGPAIFAYSAYYLVCVLARTWVEHGEVGSVPGLFWAPCGLALTLLVFWRWTDLRGLFAELGELLRPAAPFRGVEQRDAA